MKRRLLSSMFGLALIISPGNLNADTILFEDFEDSTITYTTNLADSFGSISTNDYYGRLAPDTALPISGNFAAAVNLSNQQGSGYYGLQDTDGAAGGGGATTGNDLVELNWIGIDTSNFTNLSLSWFVAEDDSGDGNEDWDSASSFQIAVNLDGAGFQTIFQVEAESIGGDQTNERPLVDTDGDGIGDGIEITDTFTQFSASLANAGIIDVRIQFFEFNASNEDFALDNVHLEGVAVPEPNASLFFVAAMMGAWGRRRRT